jgi:hypothetical protein
MHPPVATVVLGLYPLRRLGVRRQRLLPQMVRLGSQLASHAVLAAGVGGGRGARSTLPPAAELQCAAAESEVGIAHVFVPLLLALIRAATPSGIIGCRLAPALRGL